MLFVMVFRDFCIQYVDSNLRCFLLLSVAYFHFPLLCCCLIQVLSRLYHFLICCQYLSDLVVCNHMLLQSLEDMPSNPEYSGPPFHMVEHIAQFANTGPHRNRILSVPQHLW
jgi:hypothetical protein